MTDKQVRQLVRDRYGAISRQGSCCGTQSCCGGDDAVATSAESASQAMGYSQTEIASAPEGSNLGLGCGNPLALAALQGGETVLDLGSGAGFDCFLAARRVGETGTVIGVDMTPDMVEKARENAAREGYQNVEFRLGEIENLPVADSTIDLIISNCVVNLSPEKGKVFQESFRVLKPGGKLMLSDIVLLEELPERVLQSAAAYVGCVAGASLREDYLSLLRAAGFGQVEVLRETAVGGAGILDDPLIQALKTEHEVSEAEAQRALRALTSVVVTATKGV